METTKKIGIWMDHESANLLELINEEIETKIIKSQFTHDEKVISIKQGEFNMHNKEQSEQNQYYNEIADILRNYDQVLLFGPTNAKTELFNIMRKNYLFSNKTINVLESDKMTQNQQEAFVKDFFNVLA